MIKSLFSGLLTGDYQASEPFLIVSNRVVLDFALEISAPGTVVNWVLEFASDPEGTWYREVAAQDLGGGVVTMPDAVYDFGTLGSGSYGKDVQLSRAHQFCRIQLRVAAGAASAQVQTPFSAIP